MRAGRACGRSRARSAIGHTTVAEYLRRTAVIGITWPVPAEIDDAELERRLFAPAGFNRPPARSHAGLEPRPCRAAPPRRDAAAAVGGIPGRASGRLRLQPVLRPLHRMAPRRQRDDAPDPCRRREAVRGLRRRHRAGVRRGDRGGAAGARVRRRAGRVELHLRRGPLERGAGRTGSARTSTRSRSSAARRSCWSATICAPG